MQQDTSSLFFATDQLGVRRTTGTYQYMSDIARIRGQGGIFFSKKLGGGGNCNGKLFRHYSHGAELIGVCLNVSKFPFARYRV
jgi:hypothetical protein